MVHIIAPSALKPFPATSGGKVLVREPPTTPSESTHPHSAAPRDAQLGLRWWCTESRHATWRNPTPRSHHWSGMARIAVPAPLPVVSPANRRHAGCMNTTTTTNIRHVAVRAMVLGVVLTACGGPSLGSSRPGNERTQTGDTITAAYVPPAPAKVVGQVSTTSKPPAPEKSTHSESTHQYGLQSRGGGTKSTNTTSSKMRYFVKCSDGQTHWFSTRPSIKQITDLCWRTPPTTVTTVPEPTTTTSTSTTIPLPRIVSVRWTDSSGKPFATFCVIPPDATWPKKFPEVNWCKPVKPEVVYWTATYDTGQTISGQTTPIDAGQRWDAEPNGWNGAISVIREKDGSWGFTTGWN